MPIFNEVVSGSGITWVLNATPAPNTAVIFGDGVQLTPGIGNDYTINGGTITIVNGVTYTRLVANYVTLSGYSSTTAGTDVLLPYALTTLQRVKDLLFDPNQLITLTGAALTLNSTTITGITLQAGKQIMVGQIVLGTGIPTGTTIASIVSATQITLSAAATQTNTLQTLYVVDQPTSFDGILIRLINKATRYIGNECGGRIFVQQTYTHDTYSIKTPSQDTLQLRQAPVTALTTFEWRAGTPTQPSWTAFIPDQYELINPQTDPISGITYYPSGMVRVYGVLPRIYNNMIRATYTAGYQVNWATAGDGNLHQLPDDLTSLCENLVVRFFSRRQFAGKTSQALEGATISWSPSLNEEDRDVIDQYKFLWL